MKSGEKYATHTKAFGRTTRSYEYIYECTTLSDILNRNEVAIVNRTGLHRKDLENTQISAYLTNPFQSTDNRRRQG